MKKLKLKMFLIITIIGIFTIGIPMICYGANEKLAIVKNGNNEMIYLKEYLNKEFQFAFSNDKEKDVATLDFKDSAVDSAETNANHIAYIEDVTTMTTPIYMWVKVGDKIEINAREININDVILKSELENLSKVTHIIETEAGQDEIINTTNADGTKITKTVGTVKLKTPIENGKFQLVKGIEGTEHSQIFDLADKLSKAKFIDAYEKISTSKAFIVLARKLNSELVEENWSDIKDNKIFQPEDTKEGEQYILWLKGGNLQDVHFLTSKRIDDEKVIIEEVKTKLPKTYDNNTALIILAIVVVAIVIVSVRISSLKKKEMKK